MFAIYVNGKDVAHSGYLTRTGEISPWRAMARPFESVHAANSYAIGQGYTIDTSARPDKLTAYVCALY